MLIAKKSRLRILMRSDWRVHHPPLCAPKLARKYEIEHWSQSGKTINWSVYSFRINHVTSMSWHMSLQCGHVMLVSGYPCFDTCQLTILWMSIQYKRCGFEKTRLRHPFLPFDSLPYPTRTICRRVRSVNHVTTKRKEIDHVLSVWGRVMFQTILIILQNAGTLFASKQLVKG